MITKIKKRDGREVPFNIEKISNAIFKAAQAVGGQDYDTSLALAEKVANLINEKYEGTTPTVENIQDTVEKVLIEEGHAKTAKEYIIYRSERNKVREMNTRLMRVFEDLTFEGPSSDLEATRAMETMFKYGSESAKEFYDLFVLNPEHSRAHKNGDIHIHDLEFLTLTTTCSQIDILKLFRNGFKAGYGHLKSPDSIGAYSSLSSIAIEANQNDQHGGQSIYNFDYAMAEGVRASYIKSYRDNLKKAVEILVDDLNLVDNLENIFQVLEKDYSLVPRMGISGEYRSRESEYLTELLSDKDMVVRAQRFAEKNAYEDTEKNTYRAMEDFIYRLNTMESRVGARIPFSSINYGTDISEEGRMVMRNLLFATREGLVRGETAIFPIQIFKVKEGINYNEGDPNYDLFRLACQVSAERLLPNFSFLDAAYNLNYYEEGKVETEVAYMGSRTRVLENAYDKTKEIVSGRGNLSSTTINLPRLAIKNAGNLEGFYRDLDYNIDLVIAQLLERFEIQASKKVKDYPFLMGEGVWLDSDKLEREDSIREVLKHGSLSVGFIGLAECLKALTGDHHGESQEAQNLGLEIVSHMRNRMDSMTEEWKMNFSLLASPGEDISSRFLELDRELFGEIEGVTDREYYTNSFHIPVYYEIKALEKIEKEAPYHSLTNGGHISYIELDGELRKNLGAYEAIIRAMKEAGMGYISINHSADRDPVCGYRGEIKEDCPLCKREEGEIPFERIRKMTGHLVGELDSFDPGKRAEEKDRIRHINFLDFDYE